MHLGRRLRPAAPLAPCALLACACGLHGQAFAWAGRRPTVAVRPGSAGAGRLRAAGQEGTPSVVLKDQVSLKEDDLERFTLPPKRLPGHGVIAFLRALSLIVWLYLLGLVAVPAIVLAYPIVKRRDPLRRRFMDRIMVRWSMLTTWPFFSTRVECRENLLPEDQACVYVANHQSFMDILSSYHLASTFKFVSKVSITKIPVVGFAMKAARTLTIQREDRRSQLQAFRECVAALKSGISIFVFPEGTRSRNGSLIKFKKGPFAMAKRANVPIVPLTINGTGRLMPSKREYFLFHSRPGVQIVVHPPVSAAEIQEADDKELMARVRETIESAMPPSRRSGAE